jgi:tape measure domain-containing protein
MSSYDLNLNIKSEQLDQVSTELSAALQKIVAATNATATKKQDINLDLSKAFLPFNDSVKFAALTATGLGKNVVSVSKELSNLKTKLAELSSTASSSKASGKGVLNVNANTKFDTTGLEFSLKGTKEIDLSKIDIDTGKVKVVLTNTDIKLDAQIDGKINVEPVNLKLSGLIQKELAKSLTVGAVSLEKVLNEQVKAALKQTNIDLVAGSIDLSDSVRKLSDDLNLEILNAGADFNLAKAVTDLETKLNNLINQATSSVSEVNVAPVNLKISGLIQGKINDNLTIGDINLGSSFGTGLKKAITEAITVQDISVSLDLQPSIDALVQDLSVKIGSAANSFNINSIVDELEQSLVKLINDAKPVKSKVKAEEIRKSAVVIPQAIPVKLLVPKAVAVKGVIEPLNPIKVKVQTPEEIKIEADLTADFVEALSKVKVKLAANADKLITELDAFDVTATDITDVVEGFLSEVVAQFKSALKVSDLSELSSVVKDVQAVSKIDLGSDLKQELIKLSTKLSDQIVAAGGSFEISKSIQKLNQAINNDVDSIDFDFASAFNSLNLKFQNSVESISFKIEPIELAINALFGKIETALNNVETKSGSSVVSSAINDVKEKELIQRGLFQKVIPAFQESRDLGEIATGKISGSTKEGKARNALVEQKANAALTILSKVAGNVENLGRTEAEAIANLVGELENVFADLTPATSEAKKLVSAVSTRVNQLAEKSAVLKNSLASERDAEFTPLSLSENATAAIRIRKPKENTKITPNEATIEGGSPGQIRAANKQIDKEVKELAFDLRVLQKDISNPKIKTALDNFATTAESTALILGKTVEELAQIDPGFLRNALQQSLTAEGVKFTATEGLGFNKDAVDATQKDEQSGIGGMLNLLATFTTDFVKAQLGGNNSPDTSKFEQAGRDFISQTTKQAEPALVEVVKPEEVKKNEEKAAKKEAEKPTPKPESKEEELKPKAKAKDKAESKLPVETVALDFQSALKTLKNELTALALVARGTGKKKDLNDFETAAAIGLANLRPDKNARGVEAPEQRATLNAEIARTALRVSALTKLTTLAPATVGGRAEVNRVSKNVSDQIKVGDLEEAKRLLNQTKATVKKDAGESGVVDPAILRNFDKLQIEINDAELRQEVLKLTEELKAGKVDGSADTEFLKQAAEELKSLPASGSFSASQDILLAVKSLETSFKGAKTKDFKEALSIAGAQSKLGEFDNAKATLQNARNLANGELQNNQVSVAELAIDTSDLKTVFDKFITQVTKLDLAGVSDKGIADLKVSAAKFVNFPDLALKARNKIDGLQTKLDKNTPKPPDSFGLNFKSAQSELSIGQLEVAKSFLLVAESFAKGREEINKVVALFADIRVEEIKGKVKGVTDQISELKLRGVTAEGIQKVKSQVGTVGDKDAESKLLLTLKGLEKSIPKEKKEKSEFGDLIGALKKEKALGKPLSAEDLGKITALAVTRNQKAAVDQLVAVKNTKSIKPVDEFLAQSKLVRSQIRNDNVQEADVEKLKTLAKTRNQAEELLSILKKIENVSIDRAFVSFKKEAEALLTSGNKISKSQAARLEESAGQFKGSSNSDAADKLVGQIKDGLDPFKLLAQEIQTNLKKGKVSEPGKLDNLSRLARTDSEAGTVKGLREESKKVQLENEFSAFKDAVQTFKNSNDKSAAAIAFVKNSAELFKGTDKEIQANTISQRFQGKPADAFKEELRLQELNKTNGQTVDSSKLNQLASTDIEKALVFKLENALDKTNFDAVFKEFSQLVKSAINDIKEGVQNPEALNQINESASLFAGTPREIDATSQALSLQAVIDADQNRKFKAAKTSVAQNLPDADQAVQFIKDLSESSSKLANQARGFLTLKESSALLAGFTEEIVEIQRALKQKGANVPELQAKLGGIGDRFSASEVGSNKAVESRLFSAVNQSIGLESGQQAADFTKGTQLVKLGKTEDARIIFEELASDATSIGRQAQIALNKLDEVFTGLTKGEEQLLRELTAKFSSLKATSKNTGDLSALKDLATKSSQQNQTIQGSDRTDLFKDRFNKIAQDIEAAANPRSTAEKDKNKPGRDIGLTDLKSGFDIIKGTLQSTAEGLKALATAASVTSINLAKLDLANKGTVGQTAKDFEFAKKQASATGIGEQSTLRDLASFKLAIPGADQLDSNGGRVTQSVGAKEVEQILKGLQSAGTANQLSGDEQAGASNAVLQILSKGQVQSEELKRQLANFLPGTVSTFAQSQGITTAELEGRLKRGEVGIDALIGFSELLEKKFGKIAEQDTPTKAVNKLSGNIQEVGIRASAPGGAAIQTGLGIVNPLLGGVKDSAASLTTAASGIGLIIGAKFAQEAATKIGSTGQLGEVLKKTAGLFVLDPNSSIKEQAFGNKFSALGKVAGLTLGAGLLTSVASALTGAEGLDSLFAKSAKNLQFLLSGIKLPGFGGKDEDKDKTGAAKDTLLADTFTQIAPAALLFGAAIQGLTGVIETITTRANAANAAKALNPAQLASKTAEVAGSIPTIVNTNTNTKPNNLPIGFPPVPSSMSKTPIAPVAPEKQGIGSKISGAAGLAGGAALGLLANPLVAVVAPLVLALGAYGLSTTKFQSEFADGVDKQLVELRENTKQLRIKNGDKEGGFGKNQSEDKGTFGFNTKQRNLNDSNALFGLDKAPTQVGDFSDFGLKEAQKSLKKKIDAGQGIEKDFTGGIEADNNSKLALVNKEIDDRVKNNKPASDKFFANDPSKGLFVKDLEKAAEASEAIRENIAAAAKEVTLSAKDAADLSKNKSDLSTKESEIQSFLNAAPSKDAGVNKQRALDLTDAKTKATELRKAILDTEVTPARKRVTTQEDNLKLLNENKEAFKKKTEANTPEILNTKGFADQIAVFDKNIAEAKDALKKAKEVLETKDPAVKLAKAATVKENADILTERSAQARGLNLTGQEKASTELRATEGNDRSQSVRSAKLNTANISSDLQTLEDKLNSAKDFQANVKLAPLADDFDDKIKAANKEVLDLQIETEKKRTEIASSKLSERIVIEAKISEEADRKRTQQERKLNTQEAQGQLSNTVDANPQFNLNNSRLSEASAIRQEDISKKQVKDQETVVKQTVVGKEAQQDKLDDLRLASLQKSAARQAAVRSRREAEENRLLEVADIASNNRNRTLANQNSLASRVQQTFSPADQVRSAIQNEKTSGRNSDAARIDIEKQILVLSQTRFGREQQSQKLEDLKSSKLQKDTDLYLAQLARVRAEYELLSTVISNTRAAREALSSAKTQTAENRNEVKFQNKTGAISNDLAGTDTSARDNRAKTEQLQANRRTQDGLDRTAATGLASDLTTKLRKLGAPVDFGFAAKPALNATPVQLEKKISAVDASLREATLKQAKGDQSEVTVNDGGVKFQARSIEAIQAYKEFLESFRSIAAKKEADNLAIFSSKKAEQKGSIERASNSQRNTEQTQIDTKVARKTEDLNRDGVRSRQKDREASLQDQSDDPLTTSTRATASALKTEANQKALADAILTTDSNKRVRTLTANRDQALAAGQGDEANKLDSEISAEIEKLRASLTTTNFSTLESGIDNIFTELKKQTLSSERIAELNQEQLNRSRSVFELRKSLGLVEESDKDASSREVGNKIDDSNAAIAKAKKDLNKESTPSKVIDNLKTLDDATKANPVLNSLAREALRVAETLARSGKLTGSAISDIISSLDSLTISATEKATAIKFAADKIDQANSLERNQAISDVRDSSDALAEKQTTGRFSGIENSSIVNENKRNKINNSFALRIQAIDNEEFANKDNLTAEQKQVKFGSKREIARNNRDLDLSEIKSDSRKLAGEISEIITSNLKFDQFFKDIATDGDIGKAASRIGESLFDGLANYFSQKAQKSLNDVIGSFFENIFDSIFGIVKDKVNKSADPVKTRVSELISAVTSPVSSEIKPYPAPSVALAKMATPNALVDSIPTLEPQVLPPLKDIPQVESYPAPSLVVDEKVLGKSIAESIPDTQDNLETLTEPYPQPFYDLGANGVGTPVPDAEYVPAPDTDKPFFFPDYLGEKLDTDNDDGYDWRNDLQGKAQPLSNASGDWMNQEVPNIRESTRNSEALEANTQALLNSESARANIPSVPSQGGFDIPGVESFSIDEPLPDSITSGLKGLNPAEDAAFSQNLPSTLGELTPALNTLGELTPALNVLKEGLESTKDPLLTFGSVLLNSLSSLSGGSGGGGGGGLGGLISGALGSLFGGGGGSEVGSSVLGEIGGDFDLPSFADGNIREALNMPRTPGGKDPRERGADSRLAVLNAQELVVPAGMAQEFLAFKSTGNVANSLVNNNNTTSSSTSNNTTNNSYTIQTDSFGRASSAQTIISDPTSATRKRFNTNR